jgi:hypothetical protein
VLLLSRRYKYNSLDSYQNTHDEPFGVAAGAIGISGVATASFVQLRNIIDGLSEAQDVLTGITSSLENIQRPLDALRQLDISDESTSITIKEDLKMTGIAEAVNACGNACDEFNKNLVKWTKHSSSQKTSLRDRFTVGVWNREKVRTFQTRLQSCGLL